MDCAPPNPATELVITRKRGKTQANKYKKMRQFTNGKVAIEIPESLQKVVGVNAQQFIIEVSFLLKQMCPLDVKNWASINVDVKQKLMTKVKEMFDIPVGAHVNRAIKMLMMKLFRGWRFRLRKQQYLKYKTDKERLSNCPSDINPDQWKWLVNYWGSEEFRLVSEKNATNRGKQIMLACVGTKSLARIATEMRTSIDQENTEEPEYLRLFIKGRQRKNGKWVDNEAEEAYNKLLKLHEEEIDEHGVDNLTLEEAYTKVFGHRSGYVRGMGEGPLPLKRTKIVIEQSYNSYLTESEVSARIQVEVEKRVLEASAAKEAEYKARLEAEFKARLESEQTYAKQREAQLQKIIVEQQNSYQQQLKLQVRALMKEEMASLHDPKNYLVNASSSNIKGSNSERSKALQVDEGNINMKLMKPTSNPSAKKPTHASSLAQEIKQSCVVCDLVFEDTLLFMDHLRGAEHKTRMAPFSKKNIEETGNIKLNVRKVKESKVRQ